MSLTRIVQLTDLHLYADPDARFYEIPTRELLEDVVAHVEHVRQVAGVEHIGLGGDYDGVDRLPTGLEDVSSYPRLLAALADRGWSDEDLARLTCRNVLRAMGDAGLTAAGEARQGATAPA